MAIYGRWGGVVDSIRYVMVDDLKPLGERFDDEAKWALSHRSWLVVEGPEVPKNISGLAYIRADEGLSEIVAALIGKEWQCPYCLAKYVERGENERCPKDECVKEHRRVDTRIRKRRELSNA